MIGLRLPALTSTSRQSRICSSRTRRAPSPRPAMRPFARRVSGAPPRLSVCVQSAGCAARGKPRPARSVARRSSERCAPGGPGVEAGHACRAGRQIQHIGARSAPGLSSAPLHGRSCAWRRARARHRCRTSSAPMGSCPTRPCSQRTRCLYPRARCRPSGAPGRARHRASSAPAALA